MVNITIPCEECRQTNDSDIIRKLYTNQDKDSEFVELAAFSKKFSTGAKIISKDGLAKEIVDLKALMKNEDKVNNKIEMVRRIDSY